MIINIYQQVLSTAFKGVAKKVVFKYLVRTRLFSLSGESILSQPPLIPVVVKVPLERVERDQRIRVDVLNKEELIVKYTQSIRHRLPKPRTQVAAPAQKF